MDTLGLQRPEFADSCLYDSKVHHSLQYLCALIELELVEVGSKHKALC